jgi:hypothetical protein
LNIGSIGYESIVFEVGGAMGAALTDWVSATLDGKQPTQSGAIAFLDFNYREQSRLQWTDGLITELAFPAADAASKDAAYLRVTIRPESTELKARSNVAPAID